MDSQIVLLGVLFRYPFFWVYMMDIFPGNQPLIFFLQVPCPAYIFRDPIRFFCRPLPIHFPFCLHLPSPNLKISNWIAQRLCLCSGLIFLGVRNIYWSAIGSDGLKGGRIKCVPRQFMSCVPLIPHSLKLVNITSSVQTCVILLHCLSINKVQSLVPDLHLSSTKY